jgi:predicted ABC-type transport system involved in lysophospholipase L1 biosynthesis ATPase subunit
VLRVLFECADNGAALILATHDPDIAEQCPARLHLVDGQVGTGDWSRS